MDPSQQASPAVPEEAQLILAVLLVVLGVGRLDPLGPCREKARMDQVDGESFDRDLEDTILGVVDHQMAFHIQEESCLAHQENHHVAQSAAGLERGDIDRRVGGKAAAVGSSGADGEVDWVAECHQEWIAVAVVPIQ